MKKIVFLILFGVILILANAVPSDAGHVYFRGGVYVGPGWWGSPYPYYYPYYPYYSYPYYEPPVVIERQTPVYVQPNKQQAEQNYWYYCTKPKGYYPYIKKCPGGWMKVVPSTTPPDAKSNTRQPGNAGDSSKYGPADKAQPAPPTEEKRY